MPLLEITFRLNNPDYSALLSPVNCNVSTGVMELRERYSRGSSRSRGSRGSSVSEIDPREKLKDCCRKIITFMCTQVGLGALVFGYTVIGAVSFMHIEKVGENTKILKIQEKRINCSQELYKVALLSNIFDQNNFSLEADKVLRYFQDKVVDIFRHGYDERQMSEVWSFPAALMFSLSIITMIGYGNLVPKTGYGKIATVVYALFGIPLYILYFLNVGDALAGGFRWVYRKLYRCSTQTDDENVIPKRVIVPSTACLWVIVLYVLTGAVMFGPWEQWDFLDSIYFCVTSLCKLGMGDFVPGTNFLTKNYENHTKLVITYFYIFFGLGLVAMCYNLMREEIREKVREIKEDFTQCLEDTRVRLLGCCNKIRGIEEEYY